jgi:hypothetical protein
MAKEKYRRSPFSEGEGGRGGSTSFTMTSLGYSSTKRTTIVALHYLVVIRRFKKVSHNGQPTFLALVFEIRMVHEDAETDIGEGVSQIF